MVPRFAILLALVGLIFNQILAFSPRAKFSRHSTELFGTKLENLKKRYTGRYDMESMVDSPEDTAESYAAFASADLEELDPPTVGQTLTGTIIEIDDNGALLEIGGKMSGYLPLKEAALIPIRRVSDVYEIGSKVTAEMVGTLKGMPVLSLRPSQLASAWENVLNIRAADTAFEVKIMESNRGGLVCDCFGLKAFLPGSHYLGLADDSAIGSTVTVRPHIQPFRKNSCICHINCYFPLQQCGCGLRRKKI